MASPESRLTHLSSEVERRENAVNLLVVCYRHNQEFVREFKEVTADYSKVVRFLARAKKWPNGSSPRSLDLDDLVRYWNATKELQQWWENQVEPVRLEWKHLAKSLESFADQWGLRAPWGPPLLLQAAINSIKYGKKASGGDFYYVPFKPLPSLPQKKVDLRPFWATLGWCPPDAPLETIANGESFPLALTYNPVMESRSGFEKRAIASIRRQMTDVEEAYQQTFGRTGRAKSALKNHVKWLHLAISPDPKLGRSLTYVEIAKECEVDDPLTVTKAVNRLAKDLDLNIAKRPGPIPRS